MLDGFNSMRQLTELANWQQSISDFNIIDDKATWKLTKQSNSISGEYAFYYTNLKSSNPKIYKITEVGTYGGNSSTVIGNFKLYDDFAVWLSKETAFLDHANTWYSRELKTEGIGSLNQLTQKGKSTLAGGVNGFQIIGELAIWHYQDVSDAGPTGKWGYYFNRISGGMWSPLTQLGGYNTGVTDFKLEGNRASWRYYHSFFKKTSYFTSCVHKYNRIGMDEVAFVFGEDKISDFKIISDTAFWNRYSSFFRIWDPMSIQLTQCNN